MSRTKDIQEVRKHYFFGPLIRKPLRFGDASKAGCALVCAFGRNHIPDKTLVREIQVRLGDARETEEVRNGQLREDEAVFKELSEDDFDAGRPNKKLALALLDWLEKNARFKKAYVQWEVAYVLFTYFDQEWQKYREQIVSLFPQPGYDGYRTFHVVEDMKRKMAEEGVKYKTCMPLLFALAPMRARAVGVCWKCDVVPICDWDEDTARIRKISDFDPGSAQPYIRSSRKWWLREALGRAHHLVFGLVSLTPPK